MRTLLAWLVALLIVSGGGGRSLTVYLPRHEAGDGLRLAPVRRAPPVEPERVLDALARGPTPGEQRLGFRRAVAPGTKWRGVTLARGIATVELTGREPNLVAAAAVVYSLTELRRVRAVRLRLEGRPCCVYDLHSRPIPLVTRRLLRGWSGEPCRLRTYPNAVRCAED